MHLHYFSHMAAILEKQSTLTERYQTTIPSEVRQALKLRRSDKISFSILSNGVVTLARSTGKRKQGDPALGAFLRFLAKDLTNRPQQIRGLDKSLVTRIHSLTRAVKIDLNAPLTGDE